MVDGPPTPPSTIHDPPSTIHDPRSTIHHPPSTIHHSRSPIFDRILHSRLPKSLQPQHAGIALAARPPLAVRLVAAPGEREIHTQSQPSANDLGLGEGDQGGVDLDAPAALGG